MRTRLIALTCAITTMTAGAAFAQGSTPASPGVGQGQSCRQGGPGSGEQLCIDDGVVGRAQGQGSNSGAFNDSAVVRTPSGSSGISSGATGSTNSRGSSSGASSSNNYSATTPSSGAPSSGWSNSASTPSSANASAMSTQTTASMPVPDTAANRRMYGQPMSRAGKMSGARGN